MKKLVKIVGGILVVVVVLLVALNLSLGKIVRKSVNAAGPAALGVPVTLQDADIALLRGKLALSGLHVGNPEGFKTAGLLDLGSIVVRIDNSSLLTDTVVVKEIAIDGLVVTYEKGLLNSNLGALIESLSGGEEAAPEEKPEEKTDETEKPAKKVVIEKLRITGSRMNFSVTGAAALTGGAAVPVPLPPITLTDLGKEKEGLTVPEAIREILNAIAGAAGTAIAGSAQLLGDAGKALGDGAWAAGEGAVDAGKAVVDGAADAGKAIGGAAADAGKAVGDALKNVNPFKKK